MSGILMWNEYLVKNWNNSLLQEPGVYAVYVTAILQDATLSVKIASNMLEREIFNVGSREGLVGCATPSYVSRSGLLQVCDSSWLF